MPYIHVLVALHIHPKSIHPCTNKQNVHLYLSNSQSSGFWKDVPVSFWVPSKLPSRLPWMGERNPYGRSLQRLRLAVPGTFSTYLLKWRLRRDWHSNQSDHHELLRQFRQNWVFDIFNKNHIRQANWCLMTYHNHCQSQDIIFICLLYPLPPGLLLKIKMASLQTLLPWPIWSFTFSILTTPTLTPILSPLGILEIRPELLLTPLETPFDSSQRSWISVCPGEFSF